ncbi:hypothetical protein FACS1894172_19050 [Spirochaetia bacterium]|nr:hypothetical protein FACS1894164_01480 [Spirochaetia bacterium]GHU36299.1 hypothetical protein FACS1894172_19050 [Spirochaetia bacterium]
MTHRSEWLPSRRDNQLAMAKTWVTVLGKKASLWNVTETDVTELTALVGTAAEILFRSHSSERTALVTAQCKVTFAKLVEKMRFIKRRYFISPPLTSAELASLGLKPHSTSRSPVPPPINQAEADIFRPGVHMLKLRLRSVGRPSYDSHRSEYGCRIYYGVMPRGGATVEAATGPKRELMKAPSSGNDLPFSQFTRRKRELFNFAPEDSGKTAYFCIRYENAKGQSGPWGPLFSTIIP